MTPKMTATASSVPIFFGVESVVSVIPLSTSVEIHSATAVITTRMTMPMRRIIPCRSSHGGPLRGADQLLFQWGGGGQREAHRPPVDQADHVRPDPGKPLLP